MHRLIITGAVAAVVALVAAPGAAEADGDIVISGPTSKTSISGHTGVEKYLGWKPSANKWFYAIGWSERKDKPCFMRTYGMEWEDGELSYGRHKLNIINYEVLGPQRKLRLCKWKPASGKFVGGAFAKEKVARVVTGVSVCTSSRKNSAKERLKGIKLWFNQLDLETGEIEKEATVEHARRNNCKTWHKKVRCPKGEGAIGLRVMKTSQGVRGLGLVCAKFSVPSEKTIKTIRPVRRIR